MSSRDDTPRPVPSRPVPSRPAPSRQAPSGHDDPTDADIGPVLAWRITCADVDRAPAASGLTRHFEASAAELAVLAVSLELTACRSLRATVTVHARAGSRYVARGEIDAEIEQTCVVTLEPMTSAIRERVEGEFCPAESLPKATAIEAHFDSDAEDEPMPIVDGQLEIGQLVYEHLALAVDPFPRSAGAEDVNIERGPAGAARTGNAPASGANPAHPFAALAKLRQPEND